jgi:hypothetical protein
MLSSVASLRLNTLTATAPGIPFPGTYNLSKRKSQDIVMNSGADRQWGCQSYLRRPKVAMLGSRAPELAHVRRPDFCLADSIVMRQSTVVRGNSPTFRGQDLTILNMGACF